MSLLNSILYSVNGVSHFPPTTNGTPRNFAAKLRANSSLPIERVKPDESAAVKRKADFDHNGPPHKIARLGNPQNSQAVIVPTSSARLEPVVQATPRLAGTQQVNIATKLSPVQSEPLATSSVSHNGAQASLIPYSQAKGTRISTATWKSKPAKPSISGTADTRSMNQSGPPPKKGSYREIMARAQAAKMSQPDFMQIKHKAMQKPNKRERSDEVIFFQKTKGISGKGKPGGDGQAIKRSSPVETSSKIMKMKRKPLDLGYKGTMRSASTDPVYKGTTRLSTTPQPSARKVDKDFSRRSPDRRVGLKPSNHGGKKFARARYSDEEEEDDYESDVSDDMEAHGFDELEAEEEASLRAAKEEDAKAMMEENEHKRQKMEKRKKLEQLVAARRR